MLVKFKNKGGPDTWEFVPECCRCGMCCASELCAVGVLAFGLGPSFGPDGLRHKGRCPGLVLSGGVASCVVFSDPAGGRFSGVWSALKASSVTDRARLMGFGVGCCLSARVRDGAGTWHRWAVLPDDIKRALAGKLTD